MPELDGAFPAPELHGSLWLNSEPLTIASLEGKPVLLSFWDYTSGPSLRAVPYVKEWHTRYASAGLVVIGVHAPEFHFAFEAGLTHGPEFYVAIGKKGGAKVREVCAAMRELRALGVDNRSRLGHDHALSGARRTLLRQDLARSVGDILASHFDKTER